MLLCYVSLCLLVHMIGLLGLDSIQSNHHWTPPRDLSISIKEVEVMKDIETRNF